MREWLGIRGLVKTNKRPCGSPRVATSHNKPPTPCRRRHTVHRARLCSKCHSGFHDNQTATLAVEKCRVMVDGDWCTEPPGWTVWRVRWSRNSKYVKNCKKTWQVYRTNEKQKGKSVWLKQPLFMSVTAESIQILYISYVNTLCSTTSDTFRVCRFKKLGYFYTALVLMLNSAEIQFCVCHSH